jgi:IS1 family transposase
MWRWRPAALRHWIAAEGSPQSWTQVYTDGWGPTSAILIPRSLRWARKHTQNIESKHSKLRTRIKRLGRRTMCFSKAEYLHDLVRGPSVLTPGQRLEPPKPLYERLNV